MAIMITGNNDVNVLIPKLGVSSSLNSFCVPNALKLPFCLNAEGIYFWATTAKSGPAINVTGMANIKP